MNSVTPHGAADLSFERTATGALLVRLAGQWHLGAGSPSPAVVEQELATGAVARLEYEAAQLEGWDTSVLTFLSGVSLLCNDRGVAEDRTGRI